MDKRTLESLKLIDREALKLIASNERLLKEMRRSVWLEIMKSEADQIDSRASYE